MDKLLLHIDVDAFFPSVEQLLIPCLRGRPVIVGSGVIASCSYEARTFGLRAGMELRRAKKLCPGAVVLKGNYQIYRCFAEGVWDVCRRFTCGLETYLDEAYGDATGIGVHGSPLELGRSLQAAVREEVGLPVSIGLAANRMMAKVASSSAKPGGVAWIAPGTEEEFLAPLPIRKLLGVGHKTEQKLRDMNIATIGDLRSMSRATLECMFGLRGLELYERCRGRDDRGQRVTPSAADAAWAKLLDSQSPPPPLPQDSQDAQPAAPPLPAANSQPQRLPRTISRETTFHEPTCDPKHIEGMLFYLLERAMRAARRLGLLAGCIELSIRYDDWKHCASSRSLASPTGSDEEAFAVVRELLGQLHQRRVSLRHVGVVLGKLVPAAARGLLFESPAQHRRGQLHETVDRIRDRFGHAAVVTGSSIDLLGRLEQNDYGFVLRTPSLTK